MDVSQNVISLEVFRLQLESAHTALDPIESAAGSDLDGKRRAPRSARIGPKAAS